VPLDPPTRVTVTDHFEDGAGNPLGGRVIFRPSVTFKHNLAMVPAGAPAVAHLVNGNISIELVANDGPGVTPVGWTYDVTIQVGPQGALGDLGIDSFVREDFSIKLPSLPGSVVLRSITKVDPVPDSAFEIKTVAGVGPDVDGNVPLTASDIDAAGAGYASQASLDAVDTRVVTLENHPPNHAARHVPGGVDPLTGYVATALVGVSNGVASLDSSGLIPASQMPSIAISDYLGAVASQAAMLGLVGQRGDWCNRTDINTTFILAAEPASTLGNWVPLLTPTDAVTSVAGRTGAVVLTKSDVGLSNVENTAVSTLINAANGIAPLNSSSKVPSANISFGTTSTTVTRGDDARLSDARTPLAHTHVIADVTGLQTAIDDTASFPSPESATLGDYVASIPRWTCTSQDTLSNQFLTMYGAIALRAFTATKLRFHVRGAVGSPGIVTCALFKGSNRSALTKVNADITVTTQFGSLGPKEIAITGVSIAKADWLYLAFLHTNAGTDPAISTMATGASTDLLNPSSTQVICGYKTGQASIPATLDMTTGWTIYGKMAWWALAA
jgi:hypothetical protein